MKASRKLLIVAVILGLITVVILNSYMRSLGGEPVGAAVTKTDVVVASSTIPAHTRITAEMLEVKSIATDAVHPDTLTDVEDAVEGISRAEIMQGEQVLSGRVFTEDRRASMSFRVPEGMRAISLPVNEVVGVSGYISAGDKVDVLVTYEAKETEEDEEVDVTGSTTHTIFQNIEVLATGEFPQERDDEESLVVSTVTLLVTPDQAEEAAHAYLHASFHLTLRSPVDEDHVDLDSFSY